MRDQRKPRQAATVILLRESTLKGLEVFLTRRPAAMPFLGGMYCFPGGGVTKEDCAPDAVQRCRGMAAEEARNIAGARFSPRQALGFWIAAVRELFEKVGVLLAVNRTGARVAVETARLAHLHRELLDKRTSFAALLQSEDLYCDLSGLAYFSHWQTPSQNSLRFDTRFFIAALPDTQIALGTSYEVAHSLWLSPEDAMQRHSRGELPMIFPTFVSLRTLADFESVESVLKEFGERRGVGPAPQNER